MNSMPQMPNLHAEPNSAQNRDYQVRLQKYAEQFVQVIQSEFPPGDAFRSGLQQTQQDLNLTDEDVEKLEATISTTFRTQRSQYQQKLQQYEQEFLQVWQAGSLLHDSVQDRLTQMRESLGLRLEDVVQLEQKIQSGQSIATPSTSLPEPNSINPALFQPSPPEPSPTGFPTTSPPTAPPTAPTSLPTAPPLASPAIAMTLPPQLPDEEALMLESDVLPYDSIPPGAAETPIAQENLTDAFASSIDSSYHSRSHSQHHSQPHSQPAIETVTATVQHNIQSVAQSDIRADVHQASQPSIHSAIQIDVPPTVLHRVDRGLDFSYLEDLLQRQQWRAADSETFALMLRAAGQKHWLDEHALNQLPISTLRTLDEFWMHYSNGKFGFKTQLNLFYDSAIPNANYVSLYRVEWERSLSFAKSVGWWFERGQFLKYYKFLNFSGAAPDGHLPARWFWIVPWWKALRHGGLGGSRGGNAIDSEVLTSFMGRLRESGLH